MRRGGGPGVALAAMVLLLLVPARAQAQYTFTKHDARDGFPRWGACLANVTVGGPQRVGVDWAYGRESRLNRTSATSEALQCSWVSARLGLGAGSLGLGYHRYLGAMGTFWYGQLALLRTFGAPNGGTPNATYVGIEGGGAYLVGISPRIGYFVRTSGGSAPRGLFTWGIGVGF